MCSIVAAVIGAVGSIIQGDAQRRAYNSQAAAMEANARVANMQATDAVKRGGTEEARIREQAMRIAASQRVQGVASGLASDSGSILDASLQSAFNRERDVATNAINHAKEAWGYNRQADNYMSQASGLRAAGNSAFIGGLIGAGTSLLSVASVGGSAASAGAGASANDWYMKHSNWGDGYIMDGNATFRPGFGTGDAWQSAMTNGSLYQNGMNYYLPNVAKKSRLRMWGG